MAESSEVEEAIATTTEDLSKTNLSEENNINQSEIEKEKENEDLVENGSNGVEEVQHQTNNVVQDQSSSHEEKNGVEHEDTNNSDKVDDFGEFYQKQNFFKVVKEIFNESYSRLNNTDNLTYFKEDCFSTNNFKIFSCKER